MTKPMVRIHNTETDEVIDRQMTDEEYAVYLAEQELYANEKLVSEKAKSDKAALLDKLGITALEAALLLG
jgi:hypothetical protein